LRKRDQGRDKRKGLLNVVKTFGFHEMCGRIAKELFAFKDDLCSMELA
jgi:hypothetical protein